MWCSSDPTTWASGTGFWPIAMGVERHDDGQRECERQRQPGAHPPDLTGTRPTVSHRLSPRRGLWPRRGQPRRFAARTSTTGRRACRSPSACARPVSVRRRARSSPSMPPTGRQSVGHHQQHVRRGLDQSSAVNDVYGSFSPAAVPASTPPRNSMSSDAPSRGHRGSSTRSRGRTGTRSSVSGSSGNQGAGLRDLPVDPLHQLLPPPPRPEPPRSPAIGRPCCRGFATVRPGRRGCEPPATGPPAPISTAATRRRAPRSGAARAVPRDWRWSRQA